LEGRKKEEEGITGFGESTKESKKRVRRGKKFQI